MPIFMNTIVIFKPFVLSLVLFKIILMNIIMYNGMRKKMTGQIGIRTPAPTMAYMIM